MDNFINKYGEAIDKIFAYLATIAMVVLIAMSTYVIVEGDRALKRQQAQIEQWRATLVVENDIVG